MNLYPLLMKPYYCPGKATPGGGVMLRDVFMKDATDGIIGASLEVSAMKDQESVVLNGEHAGKMLPRVAELWGEALTGRSGDFPLLVKLLDAQENLSVQVHPDDAYALEHEGRPGKDMAWVILNAEPGAKIVYGLDAEGESLERMLSEGNVEAHLHWETVRPGDVFYIPAGMIHAVGAGIQCYEIQDASDLAYRLWDWNREDASGNPRPLHTEKALEAAKPGLKLEKNEGTTVLCKGGSRTYYISNPHFELCRLNLSGKMPLASGRMLLLTTMSECTLHWGDDALALKPFDTVVVPAALEDVSLSGNTKVLMSSLSDREKLREELDYRA